ncbi:MAG: CopG family transcriptional regulator [Gemmatimonadetes bacterium]|nr:CopG family transcriptional regulator [Gemmatimonadota bacterium]
MATTKMTFTLDQQTAARIDQTAARLGMSKSGVVREAVREYAARTGRLSEAERLRMLAILDEMLARVPTRPVEEVDREIEEIRQARRGGGRRTPAEDR